MKNSSLVVLLATLSITIVIGIIISQAESRNIRYLWVAIQTVLLIGVGTFAIKQSEKNL